MARIAESNPVRGQAAPASPGLVPFVAAAHEHTEPFIDVNVTPGTTVQNLGPYEVPSYGYLRHIWLYVTGTGGALGGGVAHEDFPFRILQSITLADVNGAPIFGPLDGFATLQANIWGGYGHSSDPRKWTAYSNSAVTPGFWLRIPVEISHHDGMGSLANQNAASSYKVSLAINTLANIITGGAPTAPALRIRGYLEAWSLPNEVDLANRPQAQAPPMHGTTQFFSVNQKSFSVGENTFKVDRVGNLIRNLIFIARTSAGARSDGVFPDPFRLSWDSRDLLNEPQAYRTAVMYERQVNLSARDTGVFVIGYTHSVDNGVGDDAPTLWLPTLQATRLELKGTNTTAGDVQLIINDVAPAEIVPAERFVETSSTGYQPR